MRQTKILPTGILAVIAFCLAQSLCPAFCIGQGAVELVFAEKESGEPVSARITFTKSAKKLSRPRKAALDSLAELPDASKRYEPWIERSNQFWESKMRESNSE